MSLSAQQIIEAIEQQIRSGIHQVQLGKEVELDGLELKVAALCSAIESMSKTEGQAYQQKLEALMLQLSTLGGELRQGRDAVHEQLQKLDLRRKASIAYGTSNLIDNTIPKDKKNS